MSKTRTTITTHPFEKGRNIVWVADGDIKRGIVVSGDYVTHLVLHISRGDFVADIRQEIKEAPTRFRKHALRYAQQFSVDGEPVTVVPLLDPISLDDYRSLHKRDKRSLRTEGGLTRLYEELEAEGYDPEQHLTAYNTAFITAARAASRQKDKGDDRPSSRGL
jgi:hypothetical protein